MEVYFTWREDIRLDKPLDPTLTCFILRVCACAAQCLPANVQGKIEIELNISVQRLINPLNQAAIELSGKIPAGKGVLLQVQQLLLTSYWYKSEANFVDCWHTRSAGIRKAQEIGSYTFCPSLAYYLPTDMLTIGAIFVGLNREFTADGLNDFDREMRRRVWCILDTWDW